MALKAQEVKDGIAAGLSLQMIGEGFSYKKKSNEYQCIEGDFIFSFCIDQLRWSDHYSIDVRLEISQKNVEDILQKIIGKQRFRMTMGNNIGQIKLSPDGRKYIAGGLQFILLFEEDIAAAIETLFNYYTTIAKPYFKKYNTLEAIDDIINNEPFEYLPPHYGAGLWNRCMKGLIVAKLINNPNYDKLVTIYNDLIFETENEESINNYRKVRDYLATHNIS